MSTVQPEASSSSSTGRRAPRNSSCLVCRRRKYKCDNVRPVCGPCVRSNRQSECEYEEGTRPSRRQALEDQIVRLEGRLQELESVPVHSLTSESRPSVDFQSRRPTPSRSSSPTVERARTIPRQEPSSAYSIQASNTLSSSLSAVPVPSPAATEVLIHAFLAHADQLGFFLHPTRFVELASRSHSEARQGLPSPALLYAVYLWGVRLAGTPALLVYEPVFLSRATQALASSVAYIPAHNVTHTIQAEILLAKYYFSSGRLVEGQYHRSAAVALALTCRLYEIRSLRSSTLRADTGHAMEYDLPPPNDSIDEGERILAFWNVYILDKCWAAGSQSPSHFDSSYGSQVDTPWPLAMLEYETSDAPRGVWGLRTVKNFLEGSGQDLVDGSSSAALHAKAAALFGRATVVASGWSLTVNVDQFAADFVTLDDVIDRFLDTLVPVEMSPDQYVARQLLLCHTLARVATIQLHRNFKQADGVVESKDVIAAKAVSAALDSVNLAHLEFIDPIFAILWTMVCDVLIDEMARLRSFWGVTSTVGARSTRAEQLQHAQAEHNKVVAALNSVTAAMSSCSHTSPFMAIQVRKIQQKMLRPP